MEGKKVEKKKALPRAILVFGAPCCGKTTFCEKFSKRFKAPYFDLDALANEKNLERDVLLFLVEQLTKTKEMLVIEGGINTESERDEIRNVLRKSGYSPALIWIQTDVNTIRNRLKIKNRSVAKAKAEYEEKIEKLEAPADFERPIVLSGKHTFETQLRHVLMQLK